MMSLSLIKLCVAICVNYSRTVCCFVNINFIFHTKVYLFNLKIIVF